MFKIERRFVQDSKNSAPCEGHYEYQIFQGDKAITGWLMPNDYYYWKQTIIKENFPHSE